MHGDGVILSELPAIAQFLKNHSGSIFEVGSTRDQGSTFKLACLASLYDLDFLTVDPSEDSNVDARKVLDRFENPSFKAILGKGEDYAKMYEGKEVLLAYLDGFDIVTDWPHKQSTIDFYSSAGIDLLKNGNRISAEVHLETTKLLLPKLAEGGFICYDDTWWDKEWKGKGATAIPFLLDQGFTVLNERTPEAGPKYVHGILLQGPTKTTPSLLSRAKTKLMSKIR